MDVQIIQGEAPVVNVNERRWAILVVGNPPSNVRQFMESVLMQNRGLIHNGEYGVLTQSNIPNLNPGFNVPINLNNNAPGYYFFDLPFSANSRFDYLPIDTSIGDMQEQMSRFISAQRVSGGFFQSVSSNTLLIFAGIAALVLLKK